MKDYLDELIDDNLKDPAFAAKWKVVEARTALSDLRKQANLTQEEVAQRMGVARPRVAELERRPLSVSFGRMLAYANAIGIPLERITKDLQLLNP